MGFVAFLPQLRRLQSVGDRAPGNGRFLCVGRFGALLARAAGGALFHREGAGIDLRRGHPQQRGQVAGAGGHQGLELLGPRARRVAPAT